MSWKLVLTPLALTAIAGAQAEPEPARPQKENPAPPKVEETAETNGELPRIAKPDQGTLVVPDPAKRPKARPATVTPKPGKSEETQPEPKIPVASAGKDKLPGKWVADSTAFAAAITESLQKSAGATTKFVLDGIEGDYLATINTEEKTIVVEWREWNMVGTANHKRAGALEMTVAVSGQQEYEITGISEGETPDQRRIEITLLKDAATTKATFQKIPINSNVRLPNLGTGHWSLVDDELYLLTEGSVLKFKRQEG